MKNLKADIVAYARSLGFGRVGFAPADPLKDAEAALGAWLSAGRAGDMDYMGRNWERRARPEELLAGARSVIVLAASYYTRETEIRRNGETEKNLLPDSPIPRLPVSGRIARYAWGKDYHHVLEKRLTALVRYIEAMAPEAKCKSFVDSGPLLERAFAQRAGIGFVGKNTMLITRGLGSWVFLASVVTTLELPSDAPDFGTCGSCTLCIDACPTQAITEPYQLDARRCIAYLTIESKEPIPQDLQPKIGDWVFGCDICQDVCPHNTRLANTPIPEFHPEAGVGPALNLSEVLTLETDEDFTARFSGTPLKRAKRQGLQRNAILVNQNTNKLTSLDQV